MTLIQKINSVGIDVGTTTSQAIFSELTLVNSAAASEVPRYDFSERRVTYVSPIVFTPHDDDGQINGLELLHFIDSQYEAAGLTIDQVQSGAIIITGEASKARNARETVMELAEQLGDFVVATAGPHLESVIAGHGSGAAEYSRQEGARVLNVDVGGGTSNYAVFVAGQLRDTACLNVGGRLIQTHSDGTVQRVHEPARKIIQDCFGAALPATHGKVASSASRQSSGDYAHMSAAQIDTVVSAMTDLIVQMMVGQLSDLGRSLLMTDALHECAPFDAVFISGGVGECYYRECVTHHHTFGDVGPALAAALRAHPTLKSMPVREPANTLRATVIGAGMHTLSLSGSTIWLSSDRLPLCNVPVLHVADDPGPDAERLAQAWMDNAMLHDLCVRQDCYAISVPPQLPVSYRSVLLCSSAIQRFMQYSDGNPYPLIVLARQDFGKALGMELQPFIGKRDLAVIDEVQTREWDYIDIGKGMFDNSVVPLTVKSLAFPS